MYKLYRDVYIYIKLNKLITLIKMTKTYKYNLIQILKSINKIK